MRDVVPPVILLSTLDKNVRCRSKFDLDSILQGYGFLTMLPSGDLLNFGLKVTIIALTAFG